MIIPDDNRLLNYRGLKYFLDKLKIKITPFYLSEEAPGTKSVEVGGISKDTELEKISDPNDPKTISQVLDMILFPTYAPQFYDSSITINNPNSNIFIYGLIPAIDVSTNVAYTATNGIDKKYKITGGSATVTSDIKDPLSESKGSSAFYAQTIGIYTYTSKASFAEGTDLIKDSKGGYAPGWAESATTKVTEIEALHTNKLTVKGNNTYVISAISDQNATNKTITAYNPIWIGLKSTTPDMLTIENVVNCNSSNGYITDLCESLGGGTGLDKNWYIDVPTGKTLWIKSKNVSGAYDVDVDITLLETKDSEEWSGGQPGSHKITIDRYIYNGSGSKGADSYKIKIS